MRTPMRDCLREPTPDERADEVIRQAELAKVQIFPVAGKVAIPENFCHTAVIDERYMIVGGHVDEAMYSKIEKGEYVDFGKLIQRDRVLMEDDQQLEMVICGGHTYYVPVQETASINSYVKWEQAFRVFTNIYSRVNPQRSTELIEYNHVIHTISMVYVWDNVYLYDKDFRIHMGRNPEWNWSMILQKTCTLRLRDRIQGSTHGGFSSPGQGQSPKNKSADPCRRFNRGKCTFGSACKYEHKCSYCFKFGHSILNCRKLQADQEWDRSRGFSRKDGKEERDKGQNRD